MLWYILDSAELMHNWGSCSCSWFAFGKYAVSSMITDTEIDYNMNLNQNCPRCWLCRPTMKNLIYCVQTSPSKYDTIANHWQKVKLVVICVAWINPMSVYWVLNVPCNISITSKIKYNLTYDNKTCHSIAFSQTVITI